MAANVISDYNMNKETKSFKMNIKKSGTEYAFFAVVFISLIVVSFSVLTYGRTVIHADTAIASLLAQAQIKYHQWFPDSWCYANGDLWAFSTNAMTMPFTYLIKDQGLARMLGSLTSILVSCIGLFFHSRYFFKDRSWLITIPLFLFCTFGVYDPADPYSGEYDMVLYQASNTMTSLWICVGSWTAYNAVYKRKGRPLVPAVLFILFMGMLISGMRYMAELTMPLIAAFATLAIIESYKNGIESNRIKEITVGILWFLIPSAVGYVLNNRIYNGRDIFYNGGYELTFPDTLSGYWDNFVHMILNCYYNFGYTATDKIVSAKGFRNLVSIVMCIMIVLVIPILQARVIKTESKEVQFFFAFGIFHNIEMFLMGVLFSMTTYRYFLSSVYILEITAAVYIYNHWIKGKFRYKGALTAVFVVFMIVYWTAMLDNSRDWLNALKNKREISEELISRGLTKGYAPYWDSYQHEIYSDGRLEMVSVANDLRQVPENGTRDLVWQNWGLVDADRFKPEDKDTFLMVDDELNESIRERIPAIYGEPVDVFEYKNRTIYVWDYDIAGYMANGFADGRLTGRDMWLTDNARIADDTVILEENGAVYGPFLPLGKGKYRFTVIGNGIDKARIDVHSYEKPDSVVSTEIERTEDSVVYDAVLLTDVNDIEIRVINNEGEAIFKETQIERM